MRRLLWLLLVPGLLLGQLSLYVVEYPNERLVQGTVDLGAFEVTQAWHVRFLVRNAGSAPARLETLQVAGAAFTLSTSTQLPRSLEPGSAVDFHLHFEPAAPGSYSAFLTVNSQIVLLRAVATPAPVVSLEYEGQRTVLKPNAYIDFGRLERGSKEARRFWLENPNQVRLEATVVLSASAFRGPLGIDSPVSLAPGESVTFEVIFEPQEAGPASGWLKVNQRQFGLQGTAQTTFPKIQLLFDPPEIASARLLRLTIRMASPAQENCAGVAGLDFRSPLPDDPAIGFVAGRISRWETIEVSQGDDIARFGAERGIWVQTGTTVGRIGITVKLCGQEAWAGLEPQPSPVVIQSLAAQRRDGALEIAVMGFDNTRTASQLAFSFFDSAGQLVAPGRVALDAARDFARHFESSTAGGVFTLRAGFPVSGDAAGIASAEVEITNSAGLSRSPRTPLSP